MNRKKIKGLLVMMGTMLSLNIGNQIDAKAMEMDNDKPSLQEKAEVKQIKEKQDDKKDLKEEKSVKAEKNVSKSKENNNIAKENNGAEKEETKDIKKSQETYVNKTVMVDPSEVQKSIDNINQGENTTLQDYGNLGLAKKVKSENKKSVDRAIQLQKKDKGSNLTKQEIVDTTTNAVYVYNLFEHINADYYDLDDYSNAEIEDVNNTNLTDISNLLKGKDYVRSIDIQKFVSNILASQDNIIAGNASIEDYKRIGADVTEDVLGVINKAEKSEADKNEGKLSITQIKEVVNSKLNEINAVKKINSGEALLEDFTNLGIKRVNLDNIDVIVERLKIRAQNNGAFTNAEDIQKAVDEELQSLEIVKKVCAGEGEVKDFEKLEIKGVTEDNLSAINKDIIGKGYKTIGEIQESVNSTLKVLMGDKIKKVEDGTATVNDFKAIGIKGVTDENLSFVLSRAAGKKYSGADEIQNAVTPAVELFYVMKRINNGIGTLDDYKTIDVPEIDENNIKFVNPDVKGSFDYTLDGLKGIVKKSLERYNAYVRINDGKGLIADYELIGVTGVTENNLGLVNEAAKGTLTSPAKYTKYNVQQAADKITSRTVSINKINNGEAVLYDYKLLGITGVEDENLKFMNEGLKDGNYKSESEIQEGVNKLLDVYAAIVKINNGNASLDDFILVDKNTPINSENLSFADYYLKGSNEYRIAGIKAKIKKAVKAYESLQRVSIGEASSEDYIFLGILNVPSDKLEYVNSKLKEERHNFNTIEQAKAAITNILNRLVSLQRISSGNGNLLDYDRLYITGVTEYNLSFINYYIVDNSEGKTYDNSSDIQNIVDKAVSLYDVVKNINNGNGTLADYEKIKAEGLSESNLKYVNSYISHNKDYKLKRLVEKVSKAVNEYNIIEKINKGAAEASDYDTIGIYGVYSTNVDYINKAIIESGKIFEIDGIANETVDELKVKDAIQKFVDPAADKYTIISRINSGSAKVADYNSLKINNVNEQNLKYVNSCLKGNKETDIDAIQNKVNIAVSNFAAIERIDEGTASIDDYELIIGCESSIDPNTGDEVLTPYVNTENINYVNGYIKEKGYTDPVQIKFFVKKAIEEYEGIKRMNEGNALLSDYTRFGIKGVNNQNLNYINKFLTKLYLDTLSKVQKSVDIAVRQYEAIENIVTGKGGISDYNVLGIDKVNDSNVTFINDYVKDRNLKTPADVENVVERGCNLLEAVTRINAGDGLLNDYQLLAQSLVKDDAEHSDAVTSVDNENITFVNKNIMGRGIFNIDVLNQSIEAIVNNYQILVRIDKGTASLEDYKSLGVPGIKDCNLNYVNADLKGKGYYKDNEKAAQEAVEAAKYSIKVFDILNKINAGSAKLSDYKTLDGDKALGVTADNLLYINANIKNSGIKTVDEAASLVSYWAGLYTSFSRINRGIAILNDYTNLGIKGVTPDILVFVNADLKEKNILTSEGMQMVIDDHKEIYTALRNINLGNASVEDFKKIGTVSKIDDKLDFLNVKMKGKNLLTAFEARKAAEKLLAQNGAFGRINSGVASLEDYELVGVLGVTAYNIEYINKEIMGTIDVYGTNIQSQVSSILELYNAVQSINKGLEIKTNSNYVKEYLDLCGLYIAYDTSQGSKFTSIRESVQLYKKILNDRELTKAEIISIINRVNSRPEDAVLVLKNINEKLEKAREAAGKDLESEEVKHIIDDLLANMKQVVSRIISGTGTVEDFNSIGEMDVAADNIAVINKDISDYKTITKLSDYRLSGVKEAVNRGFAIISINNGKENPTDNEYAKIGVWMQYDSQKDSILGLTRSAVTLKREISGGRYLTRGEIINIVNRIKKSQEDAAAVMPFIQAAVENAKVEALGNLAPEDEEKVINDVIEERKVIISRVLKGAGTVNDFAYLGELRVTESNIDIINRDIKDYNTVQKLSALRVAKVEDAVTKGIAIYEINNGADSKTAAKNFEVLGRIVQYETSESSRFVLIKDAVKIMRDENDNRYLSRKEILNIINDIDDNFEDKQVILPEIMEELNNKENAGENLTSEDVKKIVSDVKEKRKGVCSRIKGAVGTVEDFNYLGKTEVNAENIDIVNQDIKENHTVVSAGIYRLDHLDEAVKQGLAVYYINNYGDKNAIKEFSQLGITLAYSADETSPFKLIESDISINRELEGGRYLTRKEIAEIVNKVNSNYDDMKEIIPRVNEEIGREKRKSGQNLTPEKIQEIIDAVKNKLKEVCQRVSGGEGELEDYKYLGENRVTSENIKIINGDIKQYRTVSEASSYRLSGLSEAVRLGLAVYNINNNSDQSVEQDFALLNYKIPYSTDDASMFRLVISDVAIEKALNNLDYIDRSGIAALIKTIKDNYGDEAVIIPRVNDAIEEEEEKKGAKLTSEETSAVIDLVKDNIKKVCKRIVAGEGTVQDYNYLGETRVNAKNIDVINRDINKYAQISLLTSYRVNGLTEAVNKGLAVYKINNDNDSTVADAFKELGVTDVSYSTESTGLFNLIHSEIEIEKILTGKTVLNREEILAIVKKVKEEQGDLVVLIPRINESIKAKVTENNGKALTSDELSSIIDSIEKDVQGICRRIKDGEGTISDYRFLGENRVTDKNIDVINKDIKKYNTISLISSYRVSGLTEGVNLGLAVYKINNFNDKTVIDALLQIGVSDIEYSSEDAGLFNLIHSEIEIEKVLKGVDALSRGEILDIIEKVKRDKDSLAIVIPKINEEIKKEIVSNGGKALTSEEMDNLIKAVKSDAISVCARVANGEGTLEDYRILGETRVNSDNIDVINADIKINKTVQLSSSYSVSGLKEAVDLGLAVYNINNNNNDAAAASDFNTLGMDAGSENTSDSRLILIESAVRLQRMLSDGKYLTRSEIANIVTFITNNLDDERVIIPKINEAVREKEKEGSLTSSIVKNIIDSVKDNIKKVCARVSVGSGTLEDYKYLGESRVTSDNIDVINADIRIKHIPLLSNYRLQGLENAVSDGIAVYELNNGTENSAVKDFARIGITMTYDTNETSLFKLVQSAIKIDRRINNKDLTRVEIAYIVRRIKDHFEDAVILIPSINNAINAAEKQAGKILDGIEVKDTALKTIEERRQLILKICSGEASAADYNEAGIKEITDENIAIANAEVKEYKAITRASDYRLNDAGAEIELIKAIYQINLGNENMKYDIVEIHNSYNDTVRKIKANFRVREYEILGKTVAWDTTSLSELTLIKNAVKIMRAQKDGAYLSRYEIAGLIISRIQDNYEDSKVLIPLIYNALTNEQNDKEVKLSIEEVTKIINDEKAKVSAIVNRISLGEGTVEDYNYEGALNVNKDNLEVINDDVKNNKSIRKLSEYRLDGLKEGVNIGIAVYNINNSRISQNADEYALIGRNIAYDEAKTSLFKLIESDISLRRDLEGGRYLTRTEILKAIDYVTDNKEDLSALLPKIKDMVDNAKLSEKFTIDEEKEIIDNIKNTLKEAVNRVYVGSASVDDYKALGETRVNESNIAVVNNDIKQYKDIIRLSDYRLKGVFEEVTKAIAVYNINIDKISKNTLGNAKEYADIGKNVAFDYDDSSLFRIIQSKILIERILNDNKNLDRNAILNIIDDVNANIDKYNLLIPKINDAIFDYKEDTGIDISAADLKAKIDEEEKNIQDIVKRIINGKATLDDYRLFHENRVTLQNIKVINNDIRSHRSVKKAGDYSVAGLKEAVDIALAVYNLNRDTETADTDGNSIEFKALGETVKIEEESTSFEKLIMTAIKIARRAVDNKYIDRDKILEIITDIQDHPKMAAEKIPSIMAAIENEDTIQDRDINGKEVEVIIDKILNSTETQEQTKNIKEQTEKTQEPVQSGKGEGQV